MFGISSANGALTNTGTVTVTGEGGTGGANTKGEVYGLIGYGTAAIDNEGAIQVNVTGGAAEGTTTNDAYAFGRAYAISAEDNVSNTGALAATATGGTADAEGIDAVAQANGTAYGVYAPDGLITNSGTVDVTGIGGTALSGSTDSENDSTTYGNAYGLYTQDGAIANTADVTVTGVGGSTTGTATDTQHELFASGVAYGLLLDDDDAPTYADRHITNSGAITAVATGGSAEGSADEVTAAARAYGIGSNDSPVTNSGQVTVTATAGEALSTSNDSGAGAYASAYAYGIHSDDEALDNSGAVVAIATGGTATGQGTAEASARAEVTGLRASGDQAGVGIVDNHNTGAITATATGGTASSAADDASATVTAYGFVSPTANLNNTGAIIVNAGGGMALAGAQADADVTAYGMSVTDADLVNAGAITVAASGGTAEGTDANAYALATGVYLAGADASNSGVISIIAEGGTVTADNGGVAYATAHGIRTYGNNLTNTGDITVVANGGTAEAGDTAYAQAYGIYAFQTNLINSGAISATATAADGFDSEAYGLWFGSNGTLTNTGIVRAFADTAYELYVNNDVTVTLMDTYCVTLDGDPNEASVYVGYNATLALNDATLTVANVSGETLWDTPYQLFEVATTGAVDGNFVDAAAVNPNMRVTYDDQSTTDSSDDTVSLSYAPGGSAALPSAAVARQIVTQAVDVVNTHMTSMMLNNVLSPYDSGLLVNAGPTAESMVLGQSASTKAGGFFVEPYYSLLEHDADPMGYDAQLWGLAAGLEQRVDNTVMAVHMGYGQGDVDYTGTGYSANSEDQDVVTAGFNGLSRWNDWTLRYGLTGFYGWHDYEGLTGTALDERETASTDSYGANATLMVGQIIWWDKNVFLPEVGLGWLWAHRDEYTTDATDPAWDTTYSDMDDHDVTAEASLRWFSGFTHGNTYVIPSAAIGVRHLLTDTDVTVEQSVDGAAPVLVRSERDRTAMTAAGSIILTEGRRTLSLAYNGEFAPDTKRHNFWLRYSWQF